MGFLSAIPVVGQALEQVFGGLDKLFTSDDERLKAQHSILLAFQPVILLLAQAQAEFDKARMEIEKLTIQSEDWFIRRSRPAMSWITFAAWQYAEFFNPARADTAFYAFGLVAGLWGTSRGIEKLTEKWMNGKNGGHSGK